MRRRIEVGIVVIAVIIVLGITLPSVQQAREAARRSTCKNNLKQLSLGLINYTDVYTAFPQAAIGDPHLTPEHRWSWYPEFTPWLAQMAAPPIDYTTDSRDSRNWPLTFEVEKHEKFTVQLRPPLTVTCPNGELDVGEHHQLLAGYVGMTGIGPQSATAKQPDSAAGIWGYDRRTSPRQVTKGLGKTILILEAATDREVWLWGGRATARWVPTDGPAIGRTGAFGGFHAGIVMTAFADGSVVALSEDIAPDQFAKMAVLGKWPAIAD